MLLCVTAGYCEEPAVQDAVWTRLFTVTVPSLAFRFISFDRTTGRMGNCLSNIGEEDGCCSKCPQCILSVMRIKGSNIILAHDAQGEIITGAAVPAAFV